MAFRTEEALTEHSYENHPKEKCDQCELVFGRVSELEDHKEAEHPKLMKFNGGMFMMMMAQEDDDDKVVEEEDNSEELERERLEEERKLREEKKLLNNLTKEIICDIADEIVKEKMTGMILFAVRFEN